MKTQLLRAYCLVAILLQPLGSLAQTIPVSLSVNTSAPGNRINPDFVGLSFEGKTLTTEGGSGTVVSSFWEATPTALTRFRNLLTNLSPSSVIRVGANTGDQLAWTPGNRGTNTNVSQLFNSDIDKLFNFLSTVNWKCLYMVNFAKDSANYVGNAPAEAASEANYVYSTYSRLVKSISIGNEPMAYVVNKYRNPYNPSLYVANYLPVFDAIKAINPAIPISGGDIGRRTEYNTWNSAYLQKMNNLPATSPARPIDTFNAHTYIFRSNELTGTPEQSIDALLNALSPGSTFLTNLDYLKNLTNTYNAPFWMSETNSVAGSLAGVTNSFASAIWALDYLYTLASYNVKGANFHSGGNSLSYAPVYRVSSANGTYAIGAIYYGLLAFMDGARNQRLLTVTPPNSTTSPRASYYATTSDDGKTLTVTLINKDFTNTIDASVNLPGAAISAASYQTLRPQNNMYDVAANTFYANAQVAANGSFIKGTPTAISPSGPNRFNVTLPPMTAAIVSITLAPDLTPIVYLRPTTIAGATDASVVVDVVELNSIATNGLITVKITKDARTTLNFNSAATTVGNRSVQNGAWGFNNSDPSYYVLTSMQSVAAGDKLSFGLEGIMNPGGTTGSLTLSSVILGASGGEINVSNNSDADKIEYFQQ
ncbi:hypothetical protein [Spirosoma validum]|uniref:Beta-glucuronidase C-terminal domain-containing protein n=1 Tax=Spirosoma validum TaxID=2771355 RepID=A0A927B141_9BACT|nr:hypothetical protein [Spirosoma validum]MBD2753636.1 hypothetical protein [Spirosoma validum]